MTSSLVGSEMCIRDRSTIWQEFYPSDGDSTTHPPRNVRVMECNMEEFMTCLLYTSDAADDM
eukprot:6273330-Prorocentrum_lima.AAC.1